MKEAIPGVLMTVKRKPKSHSIKTDLLPTILILAGIVILVLVVFLIKNQPTKTTVPVDEPPEAQLDRYLQEAKPILAFFHSTNCHSCIVMMDTVAQVYPEFKDGVALVDVDVYDTQNDRLLKRAGINTIPTLVFIDRRGHRTISSGIMAADQLQQQLEILKAAR
jgi:thiol:disulfide interchange protein